MTLLMSACVEEDIQKGDPDLDNCMGVYFVEDQENAKTHTLEKGKSNTTLEFKVRRTNVESSVEVPYEYYVYRLVQTPASDTSYMEVPVEDYDKFKFDRCITFYKGQRETTVKVSFDGIKTGETFRCSMSITDPRFAPVYSNNSTSISFQIQMFEWEKMDGYATYRDGFFSDMFDWKGRHLENTEIEIYRRKDKPMFFRLKNVYTPGYLARLVEGEEEYEKNKQLLEDTYAPYLDSSASMYVDATDSSKVYLPAQLTGFSDGSLGDVTIASDVPEVFGASSNLLYGKLSKDGVITFPKSGVLFGMSGYYYFSNSSGKFRIVLPGGKAEDYNIDLKADEVQEDGNTKITFTVAKDVKKIKYHIFEGKISESVIATKLSTVEAATTEIITSEGELEIEKLLKPADENAKTGIYTVVACTYGEGDTKYREFSSVEFGYVKPGDDRKVELYFGIHTDDHYASDKKEEDYSSKNSFQYWIKGKNITHAQISYYPTSYYESYEELIKKQMSSYGSVDNLTLKMLNKDGLSGIVGNTLKPGTSYTFVIYAGNGYYSQFFTGTVCTSGVEDLMQKSYYYSDIEKFEQPSDAYNGSWIPVSVDILNSKAEGRTIRGNWRASEVTLTTDGDKVKATGLFPALKNNPEIKFELKDGLLYTIENKCSKVMVKDSTNIVPSLRFEYEYIPKTGTLSGSGYFYEKFDDKETKDRRDMMMAGFVHEDIIAFVDNKTEMQFWAFIMGGFQKNRMGEENFSTIIGDAHGELILVRKGSELLNGLMASESQAKDPEQTLSSLTEAHRIVMPEVNSIIRDLDKADIAHELLEIRSEAKVRSIMKY